MFLCKVLYITAQILGIVLFQICFISAAAFDQNGWRGQECNPVLTTESGKLVLYETFLILGHVYSNAVMTAFAFQNRNFANTKSYLWLLARMSCSHQNTLDFRLHKLAKYALKADYAPVNHIDSEELQDSSPQVLSSVLATSKARGASGLLSDLRVFCTLTAW